MRWARLLSALTLLPFIRAADQEPFVISEKDPFGNEVRPSKFNDKTVPPLNNLNGEVLKQTIASGVWLVEYFSPYCHHCKHFAPTLQTLYETYYTSSPVSPQDESTSPFTEFYNFTFGRVDCMAFGTACADAEVKAFPTLILYSDGKELKRSVSAKSLQETSDWLEEALEGLKPGSRPRKGLQLPKVGEDYSPDYVMPSRQPPTEASSVKVPVKQSSGKSKSNPQQVVHNPDGRSIPLTIESFQDKVTTTRDPWFIKFYAPWCHHCQALQPIWQALARDISGKINIGEVNCDVEKRLCKDVLVKGFPTLMFFQGGECVEYKGLRGLGDLIHFAEQAAGAGQGVKRVSAAQFEELEKTEDVIFLYMYDHATTSEDFAALERVTLSLIGHAVLVKSDDEELYKRFKISTWPRLLVSRDGKPTYYEPFTPREMRDFRRVLSWMKTVWQPIVAELTSANAREIMANKLVVLGILSRDRADEFIIAKREIKNAALEWIDKQTQAFQLERQELRDAKQLRIEEAEDRNDQRALRNAKSIRINMDDIERRQVAFAWVDGVFWERWIKTTYGINVKDGERVVINDDENHRYWDTTSTGNPIVPSRTSILETLPKIVSNPPKLSPKSTASFFGHIYFSLRHAFASHPILFSGALLLSAVVTFVYIRSGTRRTNTNGTRDSDKGGFFQLPINGKDAGALGGLLGGNGTAEKAD